jgi:flagellum-specific peptidoglycan hydrolase FlgJ
MSYTAEQFFNKIKPFVLEDMRKSGILASLTAAQALIESSKGNSKLTQEANNLFGIKGTYNGQSVCMLTPEYINHKWTKVYANFRKYSSWAESIADHSAMFNRMARYKNLRGEKDYKRAAKNVKLDGYCTDPNYTKTLISVIERYKLYTWDSAGSADTVKTVKDASNTFEKYTGNSASLVDALNSLKIESGMDNRKKIAEANGIKSYKGTAAQNTKLLKLLSEGRLIKP